MLGSLILVILLQLFIVESISPKMTKHNALQVNDMAHHHDLDAKDSTQWKSLTFSSTPMKDQ